MADELQAANIEFVNAAFKLTSISFRREADKLIFLIVDQGQGFD